ncbi:MAG TPA: SAM-dependent methyltransferase, partial [Myxococcota bacterium]|nr:SAM-dependent methyltransferase [Myxococcota bacterium]
MQTAIEKEREALLIALLSEKMHAQGGQLSFADYMSLVLYHPAYGYYQRHTLPMGRRGDFVTAPEISPLFADCLAQSVATSLRYLNSAECIEYGAGSGQLAIDLFNALKQQGVLIQRYIIIELSDSLKTMQMRAIEAALPNEHHKFVWLSSP